MNKIRTATNADFHLIKRNTEDQKATVMKCRFTFNYA